MQVQSFIEERLKISLRTSENKDYAKQSHYTKQVSQELSVTGELAMYRGYVSDQNLSGLQLKQLRFSLRWE